MAILGGTDHHFALPNGTRLLEYCIHAVLGHGGFGITYLAMDTLLDEFVAIKEYFPNDIAVRASDLSIHAKSAGDADLFQSGLAAFLGEARLIARFRHPNIMQVRRFFEANGTGYIVLNCERGQPLEQVIAARALAEPELRGILSGILDGLEAVHERAILHRDLKPSNIIIRDNGTPVLIDFGAARDFRTRDSRTITRIASSGYSPPEQYGVGEQQGPWTDLYALGAILYRCVTGRAPVDSLRRLKQDPLLPAEQAARPGYTPSLLRTIDWMLRLDEHQRPVSVAQVREALSDDGRDRAPGAGRRGRRETARAGDGRSSRRGPAAAGARPERKRRVWIAGGAAVFLMVSAATAYLLSGMEWPLSGEHSRPQTSPDSADGAGRGEDAANPAQPPSQPSADQKPAANASSAPDGGESDSAEERARQAREAERQAYAQALECLAAQPCQVGQCLAAYRAGSQAAPRLDDLQRQARAAEPSCVRLVNGVYTGEIGFFTPSPPNCLAKYEVRDIRVADGAIEFRADNRLWRGRINQATGHVSIDASGITPQPLFDISIQGNALKGATIISKLCEEGFFRIDRSR